MGDALLAISTLAVLVLIWLFGGTAVFRRYISRGADTLTATLFGLAISAGLVAVVIFLIGFRNFGANQLGNAVYIPFFLSFVDRANREKGWLRAGFRRGLAAISGWRPGPLTVCLALVIAVIACLTLTGALAPPTTNEWDALAYHLAAIRVWKHDGQIHPIPYDSHTDFPMLTEMLFAVGLDWRSIGLAKSFHWLFGMWTALACYWAGRRWVSPKAGLLAAALFLSAPIVGWEATIAYVDLAATLYVALSVFAFLVWLEGRATPTPPSPPSGRGGAERGMPAPAGGAERSMPAPAGVAKPTPPLPEGGLGGVGANAWLILSGAMAGFACGVKYTMIATTGLLVLWAIGCVLARKAGVTWKHVGILTGVAALVACPWYIRTWIWTGNPVYPFAYSIFGGRWWSAQAAVDYVREQSRFGIGKTLYGFWVAPWSTAFFAQYYANPPAKFTGALAPSPPVNTFAAVFGSLGLGVIGLLPLWLLKPGVSRAEDGREGNGALVAMVLYSAAFFVVWFALTHQTRYLMVLLPLLLVPAVAGARAFWRMGRGWRAGVGAFCTVALLWGVLPLYVLVQPAFAVVWGGQSADTYLTAREPVYRLSKRINETLPKDAKLLMLQETRGYYIDRPYQWGNPSQNALIPWDTFTTPEQMDATLRADGFTHVLVNWSATPPEIAREHWPGLAHAAIGKGLWTEVFTMEGYGVYRISDGTAG